ncbi:MAG: TldD/PmbA family protein [Thermoprotei archaeon]|nr:MAG: TldD/PmbA family protein [Thermoprotei archaeon]RLF25289.1 MAG: TldD/PmbA family protein [Thermoprotei archaeon]
MSFVSMAEKAIEYAQEKGAEYVDVRVEEALTTSIRIRRGEVEAAQSRRIRGIGVRVMIRGSWGFSSTSRVNWQEMLKAIDNALKLAKSSIEVRRRKVYLAESKAYEDKVRAKVKEDPATIPLEEKLKLALEVDKVMREYSDRVKEDEVIYGDSKYLKIFVNSEGSRINVEGCRVFCRAYVVAREANVVSPAVEVVAGSKGYELFKEIDPVEKAKEAAARAVRLLEAEVPRGGLVTAVLDNEILGLIVHEAFGHVAEADLVMTGTILTNKIGQRVASELVTIVDDPGPEGAFGWTPYDDEGVKCRKVVIIEKGVLKGYMHSRETAYLMGSEPTGNARAQDYAHPPLVRMRNTYMEAGDWDPEEIIRDTKGGFYLKGGIGGQADTNGEFMFSVQEAWEIKNGELVKPYRAVTVSGNAIDVLKSVDAVGKDLKVVSPGMCGKFQLVPVDGGGPHIRCKLILGGR